MDYVFLSEDEIAYLLQFLIHFPEKNILNKQKSLNRKDMISKVLQDLQPFKYFITKDLILRDIFSEYGTFPTF